MSAFLLLANHSNTQYQLEQLKKDQRRKKRHASSSSSKRSHKSSSSSSAASTISNSTSTSTTSSTSSSSSSKHNHGRSNRSNSTSTITSDSSQTNRLIFDINTSSYVPAQPIFPDLTASIDVGNEDDHIIPAYIETSSKYNHLNNKLNQFKYINEINEAHERLFTMKHIQLLRYSYFEQFIADHGYIKNHEHKCEYMHRINHKDDEEEDEDDMEVKQQQQDVDEDEDKENNLSFSLSDLVIHEYEEDAYNKHNNHNNSTINGGDNRKQKYYNHKPLPSSPARRREAHEEIINVSKIFKSNQFWNAVYQDIKFDNYEMYQNLPLLNKLQSYVIDYVEYFLLNLIQFDNRTRPQTLFYFNDLNYQYFKYMHEEIYHDMFKGDYENLSHLIMIMVDNLRLKISNSKRLDKLYNLWQVFLNYALLELVTTPNQTDINTQTNPNTTVNSGINQARHHSMISNNSSIMSRTSKNGSFLSNNSSVIDIHSIHTNDSLMSPNVNGNKSTSTTGSKKKISLFSKFV